MIYHIMALVFFILFFTMILLSLSFGIHVSKWQDKTLAEKKPSGLQIVEGAVFALMGLLVAFTFASANQKFDHRRQLIIEEANAIGTAYLRLDLVSKDKQTILRNDFRQYLTTRLSVYQKLPDLDAAIIEYAKAQNIQKQIWNLAIDDCNAEKQLPVCMLLLPSLNNMFDIANARYAISNIHPPIIIFLLLIGVALLSALLAGYDIGSRKKGSALYLLSYAAVMALTIYIIIDMEYPRIGFIRVDAFDQVLVDVLTNMK